MPETPIVPDVLLDGQYIWYDNNPKDDLYLKDTVLQLRSHRPPEPFGHDDLAPPFDENLQWKEDEVLLEYKGRPEEYVFQHLPRERDEGRALPDYVAPGGAYSGVAASTSLQVVRKLSDGLYGRGSRVLLCKVKAMASIY